MKLLTITLIVLALLSLSYSGPTIPDDFVAFVDTVIDGRFQDRVHVWEDYTNQRTRVDFLRPENGRTVRRLNFYKQQKTYEIEPETKNCTLKALNGTLRPAFSWASTATKLPTPCHSEFSREPGVMWSSNQTADYLLCSRDDEPLWVELLTQRERDLFVFRAFISVTPPPSAFDLPDYCSAREVFAINKPEDTGCTICQFIISWVEGEIGQNRTEAAIKDALDKVCSYLPSIYGSDCVILVNTYLNEIVQYLLNNEPPLTVCQQINEC
eukprot:TRINITY_DN441_c0_g2_i1.p1 TRINITY_DN441_c0_g2~~TRINITY_DN441_c0_g2_i1.p1  ORF type:complete len:268 (-),score=35.30 TRINITY_DN441_c0_g2_i1:52-855(-)